MKRVLYLSVALLVAACSHPKVEVVDFNTFQVTGVKSSVAFLEDGSLNPEVRLMEDPNLPEGEETKVASVDAATLSRNLLGIVNSNKVIQISGIFDGHDIDNRPTLVA